MIRVATLAGFISLAVLLLSWTKVDQSLSITAETPVWEILKYFGEEAPNHSLNESLKGVSVEKGKNLVLQGYSGGQKIALAAPQSKHFKCTSCHNVKREDPDLAKSDPEARLAFAQKNALPFLQGTTLYGAVNRSHFYNDDYEKKYGDLVKPTRNNLREAIQLCAVECSQGKKFNTIELESVLAYLWTLELKVSDLQFETSELARLEETAKKHSKGKTDDAMIQLVKSHYLKGAPAHFVDPPSDRKKGSGLIGQPENGKLIYDLGCKHCHGEERYSFYHLDDSKASFKHLAKHLTKYTRYSLYQVTRHGTSPIPGKRAYMPMYSKEKMSDQQLEDLRAYIEQEAGR